MWGLVPLYFKAFDHVPAIVVLVHRIVWSVLFLSLLVVLTGKLQELRSVIRSGRTVLLLALATTLLAANWYLFIWAVGAKLVIQSSLGYFINPLVNVALGALFLRERFRLGQSLGLALAAVGVGVLTWSQGQLPWIALALAFSFGGYGLIRKITKVGPITGLLVETAILLPVAGTYFVFHGIDAGAWGGPFAKTYTLLTLAGIVTVIPLLCFGAAAQRLRLSTLGVLQYVGPTCQFLLAVLVFNEPFRHEQLVGFVLIWAACAIYSTDSILAHRQMAIELPE